MLTLVTGGAASGKSRFAEDLLSGADGPKLYIACMLPFGEEAERRILRHRKMREEKGFATLERYTDIGGAPVPPGAFCLVECLGNLAANEMFEKEGAGPDGAAEAVAKGLLSLAARCRGVVAVTDEVGSDCAGYSESLLRYIAVLGEINARIAAEADAVYEVVLGIPLCLKGGPGKGEA